MKAGVSRPIQKMATSIVVAFRLPAPVGRCRRGSRRAHVTREGWEEGEGEGVGWGVQSVGCRVEGEG